MPSFSEAVSSFSVKTNITIVKAMRFSAMEAFRIFVKRSPVDTGAFRSNWRIGINDRDLTFTPAPTGPEAQNSIDPSQSMANALLMTSKIQASDIIFVTNNSEYGPELESGHSQRQAPNGVIRPGTLELVNKLEIILKAS